MGAHQKLSAFLIFLWQALWPAMSPEQKNLLEFYAPPRGVLVVNDRVSIHTEGCHRVVLVHGVIVAHYDNNDRAAEEYAMITLLDSGYAEPKEIASAFNCSSRSIRRYSERFESGGLAVLGRPRGRPSKTAQIKAGARDRSILRMKERGFSNRGIARRLGIAENSVRKRLRRLGWKPQPDVCLPFSDKTDQADQPDITGSSQIVIESDEHVSIKTTVTNEQPGVGYTVNPLDRSLDRLLAAMGQIEDATPMFTHTENKHQTAVITSRWDLRDIVIAYRMFERWRQENFFKYMRQEFLIDALVDYEAEPDDPDRSIPNPARKAINKELRNARARYTKLQEKYGATALDYLEGKTPIFRTFTTAEKEIYRQIREAADEVAKLAVRQKSTPVRIPLSESPEAEKAMKLSTERKHLTNVLKMVAYQIEGSLVELLRPHYARTEDEGRTLIHTALRSSASIEPTENELRVNLRH
jgi:transposase